MNEMSLLGQAAEAKHHALFLAKSASEIYVNDKGYKYGNFFGD